MLKFTFLCISIFFLNACADEIVWGHLSDFRTEKKPERTFPSSFTECYDSFFWSSGKFFSSAAIDRHTEGVSVLSDSGQTPHTSGFSFGFSSYFEEKTQKICADIQGQITGTGPTFAEYELLQYFDFSTISLTSLSTKYQAIKERNAYILNYFYTFDSHYRIKTLAGSIKLPIAVTCDNNWLVKRDPSVMNRVTFKQPEGKCHFSLDNHELLLSSGKKVTIALRGFYEIDAEYPDKIMVIKIEKLGFKEL